MRRTIPTLLALMCFFGSIEPARAQYYYPPAPYYPPPPPPSGPQHGYYVLNGQYDPYARPHFYLGVGGEGVIVLGQSGPRAYLSDGGGFDLYMGGRFTRYFALELGWQSTFHDTQYDFYFHHIGTLTINAITFDSKWFFAWGRVQPYFLIGLGAYVLGDDYSAIAEGPGWQIGLGTDFWANPYFSIGGSIEYRGVALYDYDIYADNSYLSLFVGKIDIAGHF